MKKGLTEKEAREKWGDKLVDMFLERNLTYTNGVDDRGLEFYNSLKIRVSYIFSADDLADANQDWDELDFDSPVFFEDWEV